MSEAMDSQYAVGFWGDPMTATKAAHVAFKRLADADHYIAQECDVRVVRIDTFDNEDDRIEALVNIVNQER